MQAHSTRVIYGFSLRHLPNVGVHLTAITMIWRVRSAVILSTLLKLAIQTEMIIMKISFQSGSHTAMQTAMK